MADRSGERLTLSTPWQGFCYLPLSLTNVRDIPLIVGVGIIIDNHSKYDKGWSIMFIRPQRPHLIRQHRQITWMARQLRRHPTPAEQRLWQHLKNRQLNGQKFRRQFAYLSLPF